jgi:hypothetical protein
LLLYWDIVVRLHPLISVCVFSRPQTRSRGATRRPPSRHALRASGSGSDSARTESLASSLGGIGEETTPTKKKSAGTGTPITKRADPFADLISQSDSLPPLPKPEGGEEYGIFSSSKTKAKVTMGSGSEEDSLFGSVGQAGGVKEDLFPPLPSLTTPSPAPPPTNHTRTQAPKKPAVSVFDTPVVDIFASQKVEEKDDIFGSSVKEPLKKPEKSLDELLSGKTGREEVDRGEKTPAVSSSSVEATPDAAPASKTKKTKVAKKKKKKSANKGPTDEQLFGNTDDIFGGIPEAKQTTPKTKKKKKASGEAAVVGDTHADTGETEEKKKTKKKVKKTEPKDLSMFDADAPNIFDDPLNALGSTS